MSVKRGSTYGQGASILRQALAKREDVTTSGSMRASAPTLGVLPFTGRLNPEETHTLRRDVAGVGLAYVVYSYDTPIGWVKTDGSVHLVAQRFSPTTSKHQSITACYL